MQRAVYPRVMQDANDFSVAVVFKTGLRKTRPVQAVNARILYLARPDSPLEDNLKKSNSDVRDATRSTNTVKPFCMHRSAT